MSVLSEVSPEADIRSDVQLIPRTDGAQAVVCLDGVILEANESLAGWLRLSCEELRGKSLPVLINEFQPKLSGSLERLLNQPVVFQTETLSADAKAADGWFTLEVTRAAGHAVVRIQSTLPPEGEILEASWDTHLGSTAGQREMFLRMARAEAQLENLMHRWPGVIFSQRADLSFQFISPNIEELTGVAAAEFQRFPNRYWQILHDGDTGEVQQQLRRINPANPKSSLTYRVRHLKSGRVSYLLEHRQALFSEDGLLLGYEGLWLDVTRQTIAEKRLSSAAWKETLATLTIGLAHDFSNILAGIHSLAETFNAQVPKDHPFAEGLVLIQQNSLEASHLVHRILHLHRGKMGERSYCDLNELVKELVDLIRKIMPRRIVLETKLHPEQLALYIDVVEFRQVVINLAVNAGDAMPNGGKMVFETSVHNSFPHSRYLSGSVPQLPAVRLSVSDTGVGIPENSLGSVFDPFFTTKPVNKGSGLGLYNARLFVEKHGGAISVESEVGKGTEFNVWLPLADFTEAERDLARPDLHRRTLLLLGHSSLALDATASFLRENNYYVVVSNAEENAVELLASPAFRFSGVLVLATDTRQFGHKLLGHTHRHYPSLKTAIQTIGCNVDELETQFLACADMIFPADTSSSELLRSLNEALPETRSTVA